MLIDLQAELRTFIQTRLTPFPPDQTVLHAIESRAMEQLARETEVRKWLNRYRVLRYLPSETSKAVAAEVIDFADQRQSRSLDRDEAQINSEFDALKARLQRILPPAPKSGSTREAISLTSKALWCCYPEDVPIYDNYALRTLQMLSHLCHFSNANGGSDYFKYLQCWFALYYKVEPIIEQAHANGYPFRLRVLDRFLWYVGEPKFA
jgi:hypothetical protein